MKDSYDYGTSSENSNFILKWGNITTALRWNYKINDKLFCNSTATFSNYDLIASNKYEINTTGQPSDIANLKFSSGIKDLNGKVDFDYYPSTNHFIKAGFQSTYHTFNPGISAYNESSGSGVIDTALGDKKIHAFEMAAYIEDEITLSKKIKMNAGLRCNSFFVKDKFYQSIEPRISVRYLLTENLSLKAAFSKMNQNILLLASSTIGLPTDLWLPVTDKIKPQKSLQYCLGVEYALNKKVNISLEGYYKQMSNLIEYKDGASYFSFSSDDGWQNKVLQGKGWSYGAEILLQKTIGKTSGWIGYTLSWSERKFDSLNFGKVFPFKYDRRHDISVVVNHKFSEKIDVGLVWVYETGNAITLASTKYLELPNVDPDPNNIYIESPDSRNSFRMPAYHRLDVSINFHKKKKWGERTWSYGLYNAYNRKNPFYLYTETTINNNVASTKLKGLCLFPIIPSISYNFKF